jgi:hypothetical protein
MNEELQDLFDKSVRHILKQKRKAFEGGSCRYRTTEGLGCAAAPFIKDYSPDMEGTNWKGLVHYYDNSPLDPLAVKHVEFVRQLQSLHDRAAIESESDEDFLRIYKLLVSTFAEAHGLQLFSFAAIYTAHPEGLEGYEDGKN